MPQKQPEYLNDEHISQKRKEESGSKATRLNLRKLEDKNYVYTSNN